MPSFPCLFFLLFSSQYLSASSTTNNGAIFLPLSHSLSSTHLTSADTPHLIKSSAARSASRFLHHRHNRQVPLPLSPGSDYTLSLALGVNRAQRISLYMDTGSDLVWLPCHPFECILCEGKPRPSSPPFNLSSSPAVACRSPLCSAAHSALPSSDLCAIAGCSLDDIETSDCSAACPPFYFAYGDGSLVANLRRDRLSIPGPDSVRVHNFTFGCAHSALAEPIGVAGFGRGALSLPAQLAAFSPKLGTRFSYCLVSHSFDSAKLRRPSPLILGRADPGENEFVYTPMMDNPKHPYFYSVGLMAVSVGRKTIQAPESMRRVDRNGGGGVVVDSGTTFTMLPGELYAKILKEFELQMGRTYERATEKEGATGLGLCYYYAAKEEVVAPPVVLHFAGNASVALPRRNYFVGYSRESRGRQRRVGCLMVMKAWEEDGADEAAGPAAILGNFQQQGFEVVYDLERRRVGFARRECSSLWETVSRGAGN